MNETVIQSFVWHNNKRYFISTIERDCSSLNVQTRYNETIVWDWPVGQEQRGTMLFMDEDIAGSISNHISICNRVYSSGEEALNG